MARNFIGGIFGLCALGLVYGPMAQAQSVNFLVLGGGSDPKHNEIALEKNVLYFQRTLRRFELEPADATIYFANGRDGQRTVRYLDRNNEERFKAPAIDYLAGPLTQRSFGNWLEQSVQQRPNAPVFIYATGHGGQNSKDLDNNYLALWGGGGLYVRYLAMALDRFPQDTPVVAVMAQCYSGSFANFVYEGGNPEAPVSQQPRCGFFATVKDRTSVGCTDEVDESDYADYSSSILAGLSGYRRTGQAVASADYDGDGVVSYAEAHAFAKVDEQTSDWPVSTSEVWLQRQATPEDEDEIAARPITQLLRSARPEQRYVVDSLVRHLRLERTQSWKQNQSLLHRSEQQEENEAYAERLRMQLVTLGMEARIRERGRRQEVAVLDQLLACEAGSWKGPSRAAPPPRAEDSSLCGSGASDPGTTLHHIATVVHKDVGSPEVDWATRFEALFARGGMSLEAPENGIYLRSHTTPHPEEYHQEVIRRLQETMKGCGDPWTCGAVLRMALHRLKSEICLPGSRLSNIVTR
jgi:hypothetical protein